MKKSQKIEETDIVTINKRDILKLFAFCTIFVSIVLAAGFVLRNAKKTEDSFNTEIVLTDRRNISKIFFMEKGYLFSKDCIFNVTVNCHAENGTKKQCFKKEAEKCVVTEFVFEGVNRNLTCTEAISVNAKENQFLICGSEHGICLECTEEEGNGFTCS